MAPRLNCVILDDYQSVAEKMADWKRLSARIDVRFENRHMAERPALIACLQDADIVVANRERTGFDAALFSALPRLRLLVTTGMRNAVIDMTAARARGIDVCGTGSAGEPTVELTWALILGLCRNLVAEANGLKAGHWQSTLGVGLKGKTIGLVGLGRVGKGVATVARAFGMEVLAWSPSLNGARAAEHGVTRAADLPTLFAACDIISLHATLDDQSRGLVGRDLLARMRPGAFLVNTARAALVDEPALLEALEHGHIGGVGLDVFVDEPLPAGHALLSLPNVLATPHLGYVVAENYARYFEDAVDDIEAFLAGKPIRLLN